MSDERSATQSSADVHPWNPPGIRGIRERFSRGGKVQLVVERLEEVEVLRRNDRGEVSPTADQADALMAVGHSIHELGEIAARLADADRLGHLVLHLYE